MISINLDLVSYISEHIKYFYKKSYDYTYKTQKYSVEEIIEGILYVLKTGIQWKYYMGCAKGNTLHYHFVRFSRDGIFDFIYKKILDEYFKKRTHGKLKYLSIDTAFIKNEYGIDLIGRNKYYKNKKGTKISLIVDSNGIPLSIFIDSGNRSDPTFIDDNIKDSLVFISHEKPKNNRYKSYFLGDKGYDTINFRETVKKCNYNGIIDYNKRNTKDPKKIKKLTKSEKKIYKKRIIVENCFSWILKNRRLKVRYERDAINFSSFIYLGFIKILYNRL